MLTCARCSGTLSDGQKVCPACGEPTSTAKRSVKILSGKPPPPAPFATDKASPSVTVPVKVALPSAVAALNPTEEMQAISLAAPVDGALADTAFAARAPHDSSHPAVLPSQLSPMAKSQIVSARGSTVAMPSSKNPQSPPRHGTVALPSRPLIPSAPGSSGALPVQSGVPRAPSSPAISSKPAPSQSSVVIGAAVFVKWSNGQKYRGTVSQIAGARALVVFPDGQSHWVELQFLSLT